MTEQNPKEQSLLNKGVAQKSAALQELLRNRADQREAELEALEKKRLAIGGRKQAQSTAIASSISKKTYIIAGVSLVTLIAVYQAGLFVYNKLEPDWLLDDFNKAYEEQQFKVAATHLEKYLKARPEDWEATARGGEMYLLMGDNSRAQTLFSRLLSNSPLSADSNVLFMSSISNLPNTAASYQKLNEVLRTLDTFVPALLAKGMLDSKDNPELSEESFQKAILQIDRLSPGQEAYQRNQYLLALFLFSLCRKAPERLDNFTSVPFSSFPQNQMLESDLFIYGIDPLLNANFCGLIDLNTSWINGFEPDLLALTHFFRAYTYLISGELDDSVIAIGESKVAASLPFANFLDGILLTSAGKFEESILAYKRAGGTKDKTTLLNMSIAQILANTEDSFENADTSLKNHLTIEPTSISGLNNRAVIEMLNNNLTQARSYVEQAKTINPDYLYSNYNFAILEYLSGNHEVALELFNSFGNNADLLPGLEYYEGKANEAVGNFQSALNNFRESLEQPGYEVLADIALGDIYAQNRITWSDALGYYEHAYVVNNSFVEAAFKFAGMNVATGGDPSEGIEFIENLKKSMGELTGATKQEFDELYLAGIANISYTGGLPNAEEKLREAASSITNEDRRIAASIQFVNFLLEKPQGELSNENLREMLDITRTILPLQPTNLVLLNLRANALKAARDIDQATTIIDSALAINPNNEHTLLIKADLLALDQRWEEAIETYQKAFENSNRNIEPLRRMLALLEKTNSEDSRIEDLKIVIEALENDSIEQAVQASSTELEDDESIKVQPTERVTTAEQRDTIVGQIEEIKDLIENETVEPYSAYVNLGALYSKLGRVKEAVASMLTAMEQEGAPEGELYKIWTNIGQLYIISGDFPAANDAISNAIDNNPPNIVDLYFMRANIREKFDPELAIEGYKEVTELQPHSYKAWFRSGVNLIRIDEPEKAVENLSTAIKINPDSLEAYRARRTAYGMLGRRQEAAKDTEIINVLSDREQRE